MKTDNVALKINTSNLVKHLRLAFTNSSTFLAELMQNARRAGASHISFTYDQVAQRLTVVDDGSGIEDLQNLLTVAESGWSEEVMQAEHPYGMGFLSALFAATHVTVRSRCREISFATADALSFGAILIAASQVETGTELVLEGIGQDPAPALSTFAKGFPIPVRFNGADLERPHAIDGGPAFASQPEGEFALVGFRSDLDINHGTTNLQVYLQGLPVYRSSSWNDTPANIVHLDPRQFHGRLPDRDKLVNQDAAVVQLTAAVKALWSKRLEHLAATLDPKEFAEKALDALSYWGRLDLLNTNPFVPPQLLRRATSYPIDGQDWHEQYTEVNEAIHRSEIESGRQAVVEEVDSRCSDEPFQASMYLYAHKALVVVGRLDEGHWLKPLIVEVGADEVEVELRNPEKTAIYEGHWLCNEQVVFCEAAVINGPLGPVTIGDEAFFFLGDTLRNADIVPEDRCGHVIVVPAQATSGDVVQQRSSFTEDELYQEHAAEEEQETFARFVLANRPNNEVAVLTQLLHKADVLSYDAFHGKTFTVTLSPDTDTARHERLAVVMEEGIGKLLTAAKGVIANWEKGDLALAVRELDAALHEVA